MHKPTDLAPRRLSACVRAGSERVLFFRHCLALVQGRLLRWRLETYGVYMPSLPHSRPWWRMNRHALWLLLRHQRAYGAWLREMHTIHRAGASGWWKARLGNRYEQMEACLRRELEHASDEPGSL